MSKSKYVFIILAIVYILIGIASPLNIIDVGDNLLFALSLSALMLSISDIIQKVALFFCIRNRYNFELKTTLDFLRNKEQSGYANTTQISVRNIMEVLSELMIPNYKTCHPQEYQKRVLVKYANVTSILVFCIGIASFISIPLLTISIYGFVSTMITLFAFAAIAFSYYLDELIHGLNNGVEKLNNEMHALIQSNFPDFMDFFRNQTIYYNDVKANQRIAETIYEKLRKDD